MLNKLRQRLNNLPQGPKILVMFFLSVFILQVALMMFWMLLPQETKAAEDTHMVPKNMIFTPSITIPGSEFQKGVDVTLTNDTAPIGKYIRAIYNYGVAVVGLLAAVVLMIAGVIWLTAAGNETRISEAKSWIEGSLTGLVLVLTSYIIFKTINPDLINFKVRDIPAVREQTYMECCVAGSGGQLIRVKVAIDSDGKKIYLEGAKKGQQASCSDYSNSRECDAGSVCIGVNNSYQCVEGNVDTATCNKSKGYCLIATEEPDGFTKDGDNCTTATKKPGLCFSMDNWVGGPCGNTGISTCRYGGCESPYQTDTWGGSSCSNNLHCCSLEYDSAAKCGLNKDGVQRQGICTTNSVCDSGTSENGVCDNGMKCCEVNGGAGEYCGALDQGICVPPIVVSGLPNCPGSSAHLTGGRDCSGLFRCCK